MMIAHVDRRTAFTLTELMIAVALLLVVILASARIFGIAQQVTAQGQATADVMTEATAIQQQLRADLAKVDRQGFFAIRCVSVRNDINGAVLLNPNLPSNEFLRADQLVFFRKGVSGTQTFAFGQGSNRKQQGTSARVYYGPAIQFPDAKGFSFGAADPATAFQNGDAVFPWSRDPAPPSLQFFDTDSNASQVFNGTQPPARQWLLLRQAVMLADDGGNDEVYLGANNTANSIFVNPNLANPEYRIRNGRRDIAATQMNDIRTYLTFDGDGDVIPWHSTLGASSTGRTIVSGEAIYYPRAEREAPSMDRIDHALTANVIGSGCSSFRVEWAYADTPRGLPAVWMGMPDVNGTDTLTNWTDSTPSYFGINFDHEFVEGMTPIVIDTPTLRVYEAIFSFDQNLTPWPDSLRITATLHDRDTKLENGREFQFILDLPRRESS